MSFFENQTRDYKLLRIGLIIFILILLSDLSLLGTDFQIAHNYAERLMFLFAFLAIFILTAKKIKFLPLYFKVPIIRIIGWSPMVILQIEHLINPPKSFSEDPIYIMELINGALFPISQIIGELGYTNKFSENINYWVYIILAWLGIALFEASVIWLAIRIEKILFHRNSKSSNLKVLEENK
jgi:hypothetical protein